ncbi:hypothetical protein JD276_04220 [Leucobacter sp. CSA1]|uniref:histidine kinase n=1 Tax=Leucobacter chromiisoli TaxID=2796471 RepID=A0A934UTY5_9MICO|nr:histidine kinase [Leucobacter chromiisoli]MBK0418235.1 hypothetical protein [Leucobacter chromiisoli]
MEFSDRPVWRTRAWFGAAIASALVLLGLSFMGVGGDPRTVWLPLAVAAGVVSAVLGSTLLRVRRERREHEDRLTEWAAERAAQAERLRIARELHDLASHGLGLITVRAAAAGRVSGARAEEERSSALRDIERAGRQATTELRRMLSVLRSADQAPAPLRPGETLEDLATIVEGARTAGLDVEARMGAGSGLGEISAGVQLTICAIVREGLANTARHAGPTAASVEVRRSDDGSGPGAEVTVRVRDRGPAPAWEPQPGTGLGLAGLRERVTALGGSLSAGRVEGDGGYLLAAILPDGGRP